MFHIFQDRFLSDSFFNPALSFDIERIGIQCCDLPLPRQFDIMVPFSCLTEKFGES